MKSSVWSRGIKSIWDHLSLSLFFPIIALAAATTGFIIGNWRGVLTPSAIAAIIGIMLMAILIVLRQDALVVTLVVVVHIYIDWYLGTLFDAQIITLLLLIIFFVARSAQHPWEKPRALWLWLLFLLLGIYPAIQGAPRLYNLAFYYPNIIAGALLTFWLGTVIARDVASIRRFFQMLAVLAALLAIHTIIQEVTGKIVFGSSRFDTQLAATAHYVLFSGYNAHRIGSFFVDPNWNGTFFATMLFLPLGLFMESSSVRGKVLYLAEILLILPALLFTYSGGAWAGTLAGFTAFLILVGRTRYRALLSLLVGVAALIGVIFFPLQLNLQLQHASQPQELSIRLGAWQTGINVIHAFPLTGIGLGFDTYLERAEPYRVAAQHLRLDHPHNSYIELGAKAGLPVLAVFLALLSFALWQALRNRVLLDTQSCLLLSGGIAAIVALSVNSFSINAWTLPPLAAVGWIILGAISSPLLTKSLMSERQEKNSLSTSKI